MAMFENEGFCPDNSFCFYDYNLQNALSPCTLGVLGDRTGYMVYDKIHCSKEPYVVDMFLGGNNSTLGLEVACAFRELDPDCVYAEKGKKIIIFDVISSECIHSDCRLYEDERYVVGIRAHAKIINMFLCKK